MGKRGPAPGSPRTGGRKLGTPNKVTADIQVLAQQYTPQSIIELAKLAGVHEDGGKAESEQARIVALKELIDRGHGKTPQGVQISGDETKAPIKVEYTWAASKGS